MSKRALAVSGLAVPLVGLAVALAPPAGAASCIESTASCRVVTHDDPGMVHHGIYSGDVICRSTLC